jgi:carboxylesterase
LSETAGIVVDPGPFDLASESRDAALCIHGLTGTPYEVRPLGEAIAAGGMRARGILLPGHGSDPEALVRQRYGDWLEAARGELRSLRERHERVFCVGVSLGGLISLALAAEERVDAIVVIGTPLHLPRAASWLVPLAKHVYPFLPKRTGSDIRDPTARARHPSLAVMPLASIHELLRLQRRVRSALAQIATPILVAHGLHDNTASPEDAQEILRSVSSEVSEWLPLEASGHVASVDHDGPRLASAVAEFLDRWR